MKRLMVLIALASSLFGCAYNDYKDTTPTSKHSSDLTRTLAGQSVSNSTERTKSDYDECMAKNAGYDGAKAQCDAWIAAAQPGTMPKYQGWGWYPNYIGGYGQRSPYVTPGMVSRGY
ncbi:MAG: hypothetical protein WC551_06700 [Patescibacteria group bacterium]